MWTSILVRGYLSHEVLRTSLADIFGVALGSVLVRDVDDTGPSGATFMVVGSVMPVHGDFSILLEVFVDPDLEPRGTLAAFETLCRSLQVEAWMGDDSIDPGSGYLVSPEGRTRPAHIDLELEEDGVYRLETRGAGGP